MFHDAVEPIECSEGQQYFFSVSTLTGLGGGGDVDDAGIHFFDIFPSLSVLSLESVGIDFHDFPCIDSDSTFFTDWIDLHKCNDTAYLDCIGIISKIQHPPSQTALLR